MTKSLVTTALLSALFVMPAFSAEHMESMPHDMDQWDEHQMQMHNQEMEAHLKQMQELMDKMHETNDPAERRRLYQEHHKQMNEFMSSMRSSRDDMMMGMMGGGPRHGREMPEGERLRHHMIEKRLDMMDNAMDMMMRRDEMMMKMNH